MIESATAATGLAGVLLGANNDTLARALLALG